LPRNCKDGANPIISHNVANICRHPHVKGHANENGIYGNWRVEDVWLDKQPPVSDAPSPELRQA
jgi:hypothetical protein